MAKKKRAPRPRTGARELERQQEKLWHARERLALLEPGGTRERPLDVRSASVVETRAETEPCLRCGGPLRCEEHSALTARSGLVRLTKLCCRDCGATRELYFRIVESYLN